MHNLKFKPGAVEGGTGSLGEPRGRTQNDLNKVWRGFHGKRKHQESEGLGPSPGWVKGRLYC